MEKAGQACCARTKTHVSLLDTHSFEDVGSSADLLEQLLISQFYVLSGLICLPNDGSLFQSGVKLRVASGDDKFGTRQLFG